jgi:catechol 2,3-dioxygenase-like lactoylglutathione lyase family enzyme
MQISDGELVSTVAVKDMAAAKKFYSETLELKLIDENQGGITYQCGKGRLFVYESPTAGTNQATCAAWEVADIETAVKELKDKGISFEHYDMPGGTREGDIHSMGPFKAAWFKDPDGNIFSLDNNVKS